MKIIERPQGWFTWSLVGAWALLLMGTLFVFLFPKYLAAMLIKPLWILSIFVVLGTWVYGVIRAVRLFRRWIGLRGSK